MNLKRGSSMMEAVWTHPDVTTREQPWPKDQGQRRQTWKRMNHASLLRRRTRAGRRSAPSLPFRTVARVSFVIAIAMLLSGSLLGAELSFDGWVEAFSADWVRGDPMQATTTQYFDDAEQD